MPLYKVRKLTTGNKTGDAFGITVPKDIAQNFDGISFIIVNEGIFIEYQKRVIETIVHASRVIRGQVGPYDEEVVKKKLDEVKITIQKMGNPFENTIIYKSGAEINVE